MIVDNQQIAIVGGGPGGLTMARLLQQKGAPVKLYERDVDKYARVQGAPLDMHEGSGAEAVRRAGLWDLFMDNVRQGADKKIILDKQGNLIFSDHENAPPENKPSSPEIDRGALRKLLLDSLMPGTVVWDSHFMAMDPQGEGWLLHFANGHTAYADIVVAADGANSRIRPYITGSAPFYTGYTMVEVNVTDAANNTPHIQALLNGGKVMAFGNGQCILGGQKGEGGLGFYLSFQPAEDWAENSGLNYGDRPQVLRWFKKTYDGWSTIWDEVLMQASMPVIPRRIYCMPPDQHWQALRNLTMLGDAAHMMPPFAGEGANMAMLDAVELSDCLTTGSFRTVHEAIASYEERMRTRAAAAARQSIENGARMHAAGTPQKIKAIFGLK